MSFRDIMAVNPILEGLFEDFTDQELLSPQFVETILSSYFRKLRGEEPTAQGVKRVECFYVTAQLVDALLRKLDDTFPIEDVNEWISLWKLPDKCYRFQGRPLRIVDNRLCRVERLYGDMIIDLVIVQPGHYRLPPVPRFTGKKVPDDTQADIESFVNSPFRVRFPNEEVVKPLEMKAVSAPAKSRPDFIRVFESASQQSFVEYPLPKSNFVSDYGPVTDEQQWITSNRRNKNSTSSRFQRSKQGSRKDRRTEFPRPRPVAKPPKNHASTHQVRESEAFGRSQQSDVPWFQFGEFVDKDFDPGVPPISPPYVPTSPQYQGDPF